MTLYSVNSHSAAFQEGEAAFADESEFDDNPHEEGSADFYNWQAGWEAAEAEQSFAESEEAERRADYRARYADIRGM